MEKSRIARINELARKSRAEGLTDAEKTEQAALRQEYLADFRENLRAQLDHTVIEEPDGTRRPLRAAGENGGTPPHGPRS